MVEGKIVVFCGPSGAGKTTVSRKIMQLFPVLELSVSATTRQPRAGEIDGKDYYFITAEEFKSRVKNNEFLEYEEVYHDLCYGTLNAELERIWSNDKVPFLDLDVKGAANLKKMYGNKGLFVFVHPGSIQNLADRLTNRGTENEESLKKRLGRAEFEMTFADQFDFVLINNIVEQAVAQMKVKMETYLNSNLTEV